MPDATRTLVLPASTDPLRLAVAGFLARYTGRTLATYRIHLDLWLRWCDAAGVHPLEVRRPHVEIWLRHLEQDGLASATRSLKYGVVHLFYRYAVVDELIAKDPTEHVDRPKVKQGEQRRTWLPTLDSVALLQAAMKTGPREHLFVVLLGQMALRVGEMCSLDVESVRHNQLPAPVRALVRAELYDGSRVVLELDVVARSAGFVCVRQERPGRPPWHAWVPADRAERL